MLCQISLELFTATRQRTFKCGECMACRVCHVNIFWARFMWGLRTLRTHRHIIYVHPFENLWSKVDVEYIREAMKSETEIECNVYHLVMSRFNDSDIQNNWVQIGTDRWRGDRLPSLLVWEKLFIRSWKSCLEVLRIMNWCVTVGCKTWILLTE